MKKIFIKMIVWQHLDQSVSCLTLSFFNISVFSLISKHLFCLCVHIWMCKHVLRSLDIFFLFFFFNPTGAHKEYVQGAGLKAKKSLLLLLGLIHVSFHLLWMNLIEVFWQRELECWFQLCVLHFLFPLNSPFTSCSLGSYPPRSISSS